MTDRQRVLAGSRAFILSRLSLENLCLAIILLGVGLRVESYFEGAIGADGALYAYAAGSWLQLGRPAFLWSEPLPPLTFGSLPLLHVLTFIPSFSFGGVTQQSAKLSCLAVSLGALAVTFYTTKNLVGRSGALVTTGLFGSIPVLITAVGTGYGENTLLLTFTLTVWAFLRGVRDDGFFAVFALCATGLLLTKQEVTPYVVFAGLVAFYVWRLRALGRSIIRAWGTLVVGPVLALEAFVRNLASGRGAEGAFSFSVALSSASFWQLSVAKLVLILGIAATVGLFLGREIYLSLRTFKKPETFPYVLVLGGVLLVAWIESSIRIFNEPFNPVFSRDDQRYVFISFLPIALIAISQAKRDGTGGQPASASRLFDFSSRSMVVLFVAVLAVLLFAVLVGSWLAAPLAVASASTVVVRFRHRAALLLLTVALLGANSVTSTIHYSVVDAAHALDCWTAPSDRIALDTPNRSIAMADVYINIENRDVIMTRYNESSPTDFLISDGLGNYSGFLLVGRFNSTVERTGLARVVAGLLGEQTQMSSDPITSVWMSQSISGRTPRC